MSQDLDARGGGRMGLLVIDVQEAFATAAREGARRNNAGAEARIAELLDTFRALALPVLHVRHASERPGSDLRRDRPGFEVQAFAREREGEAVYVKSVNCAFIGTSLEEDLRRRGISDLAVVGATSNHCVETTTRVAGNLGFNPLFVRDGTWTFDRRARDGSVHPAEIIQAMTEANLDGEFAEIISARDLTDRLRAIT